MRLGQFTELPARHFGDGLTRTAVRNSGSWVRSRTFQPFHLKTKWSRKVSTKSL